MVTNTFIHPDKRTGKCTFFYVIHDLSLKAPLFLQHTSGNIKYAVNILDLCSFVHIFQLLPVSILSEAHAESVDAQLGRQPGDSWPSEDVYPPSARPLREWQMRGPVFAAWRVMWAKDGLHPTRVQADWSPSGPVSNTATFHQQTRPWLTPWPHLALMVVPVWRISWWCNCVKTDSE